MSFGVGEILLVLLLAFVVFGPRRASKARPHLRATIVAVLAACAPALVLMERAGVALRVESKPRLILIGVAALSALFSVLLARMADRWFERADAKAAAKARAAGKAPSK